MTPFLQFRIWLRRATAGQKASASGAAALALGLVIWAAIPTPARSAQTAVAGTPGVVGSPAGNAGAAGHSSLPPSSTPQNPTGSPGATQSATPGPGSSTAVASATTLPGIATGSGGGGNSAIGVGTPASGCKSTGILKIGVVVPVAAGGSLDAVIGNPPGSQEEADYAAVIDYVNKQGGVACNKLVGDYAQSDLTNPSGVQTACIQFQQDKVFAVLGGFEPEFSDDCLLQAHIPVFDEVDIPQTDATKYYPYYFSTYPTYERLYKNFVDAMNQMGYFGAAHHFGKIGIFYRDCTPSVNQDLLADLAAVGVSGSHVVTANLGCPSTFANPSTELQDAVTFKNDGVTTATIDNAIADIQNISNQSNTAGFHPTWILPDYGESATMQSAQFHPNAREFEGAVAITSGQYGAIASALPETPGTKLCDQIMTSHGLPTVYQSGDQFAGSPCSLVWMLTTAIAKAGVNPTGLVAGLQAAGSTQVSFPNGPNNFSTPGTSAGGEFWREIVYHGTSDGGCQCFTVVNPTWNSSF